MTDYKEEQAGELEALESIFVTELEIVSHDPYTYIITIPCEIRDVDVAKEPKEFTVGLRFKLPDEYPDVPPVIDFTEGGDLDEDLQKTILIELNKFAEEEVGCVMIFTLISELQDKVNEFSDAIYNKKLQEKEDIDKIPVFHGTIITRENFMEWQAAFVQERNLTKVQVVVSDKLTGKQIFMAKGGNIEIEGGLIGETDDVDVDESLFDEELVEEELDCSDSD